MSRGITAEVRARFARSVAWSGGGSLVMRLGQLFVGIVSARLLTPHDFGVFAVTLTAYSITINISELGVGAALIRSDDSELERSAPTGVTVSLASSAALAGLMCGFAGPIATVLGSAQAADPMRVMSIALFLAGPTAVPAALLARNFRQDIRFWADLSSFVVGSGTVLLLAASGWGAFALAWSRVFGLVASAVVLLAAAPRTRLGFHAREARRLIMFSLPLVGSSLIGFAIGSTDVVVIAHLVGTAALGAFTLANNIAAWPLGLMSTVLVSIGLPMLARVKDDPELLHRYLRTAMKAVGGVFFFVSAMLAALSVPVVHLLYGPKWDAAGPLLAVLAGYGAARVILALLSDLLVARGAPHALFWAQIVWIAAVIPALLVGTLADGARGAAVADAAVAALVVLPATVFAVRRAAGIRSALAPLLWPALAALLAGGAAWAAAAALPGPAIVRVLAGGLAGSVVYALLMLRWARATRDEARGLYAPAAAPAAAAPSAEPEPVPAGGAA